MVEGLYRFQHLSTFISWFLKGLLQINEQQCFWEDSREFEEPCTCRTDYRCSYFTQTGKASFCRGNLITDCLTVIQCKVGTLTSNRPIYMGFSLLELSKLHMYDLHYNHMC